MEAMPCRECGIGLVRMLAVVGRTTPYKNLELEVPATLELPTCDNCGAEWLDHAATEALDDALELAYRAELANSTTELIGSVPKRLR